MFVGYAHKLYSFFKELYADYSGSKLEGKTFKNFKHAVDLNTELSGGIGGKAWYDEFVVLEGETFISPLRFYCPDITNNRVLSVHYHDPVYDNEYIFKSNILDGAK
jgi:hypothetical protein